MKHVMFVAAENAALPGGKVGGIGDVMRDLPVAMVDEGWQVTTVVPAYGFLQRLPGVEHLGTVDAVFAGNIETVQLYEAATDTPVRHVLLDHPLLSPQGAARIYCDDGPARPFATDATKFAFFCAAVAAWLTDTMDAVERPDVIHLHDWHAAFLLLHRQYMPEHEGLQSIRFVHTIHNLAMQGIRPLRGDPSALESWHPGLEYDAAAVGDPRYAECINPMAMAIRLADAVNTVSPTYAREICIPDDPDRGFYGAEGLEGDTRAKAADGQLFGILNGCMYPQVRRPHGWRPLARVLESLPGSMDSSGNLAACLQRFRRRRPGTVVTSIGRITPQKVALFLESVPPAASALDLLLRRLGDDSLFVMLGSGDAELEQHLRTIVARHANALLLTGYDEKLAAHLYDCGDLFLMPSSFEPCGISQMLAMRSGQPCIVHGVGGLRDTVSDGETGFVFAGTSPAEQARAFVSAFDVAMHMRETNRPGWQGICRAAAAQRFDWPAAARAYIHNVYASSGNPGTELEHDTRT